MNKKEIIERYRNLDAATVFSGVRAILIDKALKEYNENKGKFRDAVKNGEIDKTANPYYLEKYKELTLNSFAIILASVVFPSPGGPAKRT